MCPEDIRMIELFTTNNIPMVLHSDEEYAEIYIYVSQRVKENIVYPIRYKKINGLLKKNISCSPLWHTHILCKNSSDIVHYFCSTNQRYVFFVDIKSPCIAPLQVFYYQQLEGLFFGIKNKTITPYFSSDHSEIIKKYLL
jgi:hypothetical protein